MSVLDAKESNHGCGLILAIQANELPTIKRTTNATECCQGLFDKLRDASGITDLKIAGLRRRDGREQSAIGFEIEQWRAV